MPEAVGVKLGTSGKIYGFKADGLELRRGEMVVVESDLGLSIGRVIAERYAVDTDRELRPVLRRVTEADLQQEQENQALKVQAHAFCNERIMARGLPMKLVATDVTLDRKRFIFYFVADTRIDFRELVKDLAANFRTRIELRQIGVRDEAKMVGGLGVCGRDLCCRRFLTSFAPISIRMAKQQELVLNTCKLSGVCGRLMCCLSYECGEEPCEKEITRTLQEASCVVPEAPQAPGPAPEARPAPQEPEKAAGSEEPRKHFKRQRRRRFRRPKKK